MAGTQGAGLAAAPVDGYIIPWQPQLWRHAASSRLLNISGRRSQLVGTMVPNVELEELAHLSEQQLGQLRRLTIPDQQIEFGGAFDRSVDDCLSGPPESIRGLAILVGRSPIGLVTLKRPPCSPDWASEDMVTLHALKIDAGWQGKGYGRAAMAGAMEMTRSIWPDARHLALTVDADNIAGLSLYRSFGMSDSGPVFQGRIGLEHRLQIALY